MRASETGSLATIVNRTFMVNLKMDIAVTNMDEHVTINLPNDLKIDNNMYVELKFKPNLSVK